MTDRWEFFNWPEIVREARMRHEQAVLSTAAAITPEMRTLEYWTAWCAHANLASTIPYHKDAIEVAAQIAENFYLTIDTDKIILRANIKNTGAQIAAAIRKVDS